MEPLSGLKSAAPALLGGFRAIRRELARRSPEDGSIARLSDIDDVVHKAIAILARQAESLADAVLVNAKGSISRPKLFDTGAPSYWIATEIAQTQLKNAVRVAIKGGDDAPHARAAQAHYVSMLEGDDLDAAPDASLVYVTALDFILRSLKQDLTAGDRILLNAVEGIHADIERLKPADASDLVDAHVEELLTRMRRARFFRSSDTLVRAKRLVEWLREGRLRDATSATKVRALAWCVRILAQIDAPLARDWLDRAEALANEPPEILIVARAFVAANDNWRTGLALLKPDGSPIQATAAFQIMRHGLGAPDAIAQAEAAGLDIADFDSDGRYAMITALLENEQWDAALAATRTLSAGDFDATPALLWMTASLLVATRLPLDLRRGVLQDIPSNPAAFPLREDTESLQQRRLARELMDRAATACSELDLALEAAAARRYSLWLDLRDFDRQTAALETLRRRIDEPGNELGYLSLALTFDLAIDRDKAKEFVGRRLALNPEPSAETVNAMIALLIDEATRDPTAAANFLKRHRAVFAEYLEANSFLSLEVGILADAGRSDEARALLLTEAADAIPESQRALLRSAIDADDAAPSLDALEAVYRDNPQSTTLIALVRGYRELGVSSRFIELARKLLSEVPGSRFAHDIIGFLRANGHELDAFEFIKLIGDDIVDRSEALLAHASALSFHLGDLAAADSYLARLEARRDIADDRALRYQLLVTSGDWEGLDAFLDRQWQRRDNREGLELAQCATLAAQIDAKRVVEFIRAAVTRAPDNPNVLIAAYTAATSAGIEEELPEAHTWIMRAAELSNEDGPVQKLSISEIMKLEPDWDTRVDEATAALVAGTAPIAGVAGMLRRSWLEFHLTPLLTNPDERDVRRYRLVVPFSGRQRIAPGESLVARRIALDHAALVTLAAYDLLDVLDHFDEVVLPHDALAELFEQRNRLTFHQPSKIAFARRLLELVARGTVSAFAASSVPDLGLVADIGQSRAALLSEAASQTAGQHLFVHPFPITRAGSLLSEPVPLDAYHAHLVSCSAVIEALVRAGRVTESEASTAQAYLDQHERRWPEEPTIADGATLYLSDLSVAYLRYIGLLDKIASAGLHVVVSQAELTEARALRDSETTSHAVDQVLARLRTAVTAGLTSGRIVLDAAPAAEEARELGAFRITSLVARSEVIVSDDRFLNRYEHFEHDREPRRILSTLTLLTLLANDGRFAPARLAELRTRLRRAGASYIPIDPDELLERIAVTTLRVCDNDGTPAAMQETGELRALRENIRLAQARGWFDPETEMTWLIGLQTALADAIAAQWTAQIPDTLARARSDWLARLLDTRAWADSVVNKTLDGLACYGAVLDLAKLVGAARAVDAEHSARFEAWLEHEVVAPYWVNEPGQREVTLNHLRGMVVAVGRDMHRDMGVDERVAARMAFQAMPQFLQSAMLGDSAFENRVGVTLEALANVGNASFSQARLIDKARALYADPTSTITIIDSANRRWTMSTDHDDSAWSLRLRRGKVGWRVRGLLGLHPDASERLAMFDSLLAEQRLAPMALADWRLRLAAAPFTPRDIEAVDKALRDTPPAVEAAIVASLTTNEASIDVLVPAARAYWDHLIGASDAQTFSTWLETPPRDPLGWTGNAPLERVKWALLLAAHPKVVATLDLGMASDEDWRALGEWVVRVGDPLAKIGFLELALPHAHRDPKLETIVLSLAKTIEAYNPDDEAGPLFLLASLTMFVDGELSRTGALGDAPPFRRRLAAMAQAALISRIVQGEVDTAHFAKFALAQRGWRFAVQNLADLRREPRWRPDFLAPEQLRHELIGRVVNAAGALPEDAVTPELHQALLADTDSLRARMAFPMVFLPGPLEGGGDVDLQITPDYLRAPLEEALGKEPLGLDAVTLLVNIAATFYLSADVLDSAVDRLRGMGPRLLAPLSPSDAYTHLLGLAHIAASHRHPLLADTVQIFARHHRARFPMGVADEIQLALHAAAAHEDAATWRDWLGGWILELAIATDERDHADLLDAYVATLSEVDPLLRTRTGRARANLRLVLDS
ncbi:hypothetical protein [Sphingomonas aerolata]|uniref:HTH domain-containing protein n=1 Tax=Sphingomonas aerolata TaxID=185951 RepID=UPI002FDF30FD